MPDTLTAPNNSLSLSGLFYIGLYGDVTSPSSANEDKPNNTIVWSSSAKMALLTLRKSSSIFTPPQTILKSQTKAKTQWKKKRAMEAKVWRELEPSEKIKNKK